MQERANTISERRGSKLYLRMKPLRFLGLLTANLQVPRRTFPVCDVGRGGTLELGLLLAVEALVVAAAALSGFRGFDQVGLLGFRGRESVGAEFCVGPPCAGEAVAAGPVFGKVMEEAA